MAWSELVIGLPRVGCVTVSFPAGEHGLPVTYREPSTDATGSLLTNLLLTSISLGAPKGQTQAIRIWANDPRGGATAIIRKVVSLAPETNLGVTAANLAGQELPPVPQFTAAVKTNPSDEAVAQWSKQTAKPHPAAELDEWNRMMLTRGPRTPEKQEYFNKLRDAVDPSRTDLTAWADLQDLEEGRTVPKQQSASR